MAIGFPPRCSPRHYDTSCVRSDAARSCQEAFSVGVSQGETSRLEWVSCGRTLLNTGGVPGGSVQGVRVACVPRGRVLVHDAEPQCIEAGGERLIRQLVCRLG